MKKALMVCVLVIIISFPVYALKITISGKAEIGSDILSYNMFTELSLGLNFYIWKFKNSTYGSYRTWMIPEWGVFKFNPYRAIYTVGNKITLYGFFIDIQHFCNHPVKSNKLHKDAYGFENKKWRSNFWGETIDTISIGYKFEFPIWKSKKT